MFTDPIFTVPAPAAETFDIVKLVNPSIVELLLNNTCVLSAKPIERSVITSTLVENKVPVTL